MSGFKCCIKCFLLYFLVTQNVAGSKKVNSDHSLQSVGYNICFHAGMQSEQWAHYLYNHLSNRMATAAVVLQEKHNPSFKQIVLNEDDALSCDYSIENTSSKLVLKARNKQTMLLLIYQFIKELSNEDERVEGEDLPPAYFSFSSGMKNVDFNYREPYFTSNLDPDYASIIGTNRVESDWGIWGHHLGDVLIGMHDPYCFSSDSVFHQIKQYILENFGKGDKHGTRFMIMPNDNSKVCTCKQCTLLGNTKQDATPALSFLINRLAKEFPHHTFFTTAYLSVHAPSKLKWENNTGVMMSTIDLPKGVALKDQHQVKIFLNQLDEWKKCTPNIYVWDYAANFDDYLTPLPVLYGLQKQLKFYKSIGIKGVFLNASGYNYSPFEDVKTVVGAALMVNVDVSVDSLCRAYFSQFYPQTGQLLCNYYLSLEQSMQNRDKPYQLYGGFQNTLNIYLDQDTFIKFYHSLQQALSTMSKGREKEKLDQLYAALSYTRLQIAYVQKKMDVAPLLQALAQYKQFKNLKVYKEVNGNLDDYLNNWDYLCKEGVSNNLLKNESLHLLSKTDEGYEKPTLLNDGVSGFYGNYHQGWYLSSLDDLEVRFSAQKLKNAKTITLRFLVDEQHAIYPPEKIVIYKNASIYKQDTSFSVDRQSQSQIVLFQMSIDLSNCDSVDVKVFKKQGKERSTLACDEIKLN